MKTIIFLHRNEVVASFLVQKCRPKGWGFKPRHFLHKKIYISSVTTLGVAVVVVFFLHCTERNEKLLPRVINKFYKEVLHRKVMENGGGFMAHDIDEIFLEFVQKNYKMLTENQKNLCEKMGISVPR